MTTPPLPPWPEKPHLLSGCRKWNFYWHEHSVAAESRLRVAVRALQDVYGEGSAQQRLALSMVETAQKALALIGPLPPPEGT
jgi:hypothetical protein